MHNVVDNPIPQMQGFRDYLVTTFGEANARVMTQSLAAAYTAIIDAGGSISLSKARNITAPVLLITGEHDFLVSMTLLSQLAESIQSVEAVVAEGAGHPVHQTHGEWLTQTILDWLERCPARVSAEAGESMRRFP